MVRLGLSIALAFALAASTRAEWSVTSSQTERGAAAGLEHRRVVLSDSDAGEQATLDIAIFSAKSATVRVIDNPAGEDLAGVMQREHCLAGVNGGYFDPADAPVGLLISDGKIIAPLRKAKLLSGVLVVANGRVQLFRTAEYSPKRKAIAALQCGPFLVDRAQPVPGLNDIRGARRTFILTDGSDRAALGFCSEATLAQLGKILATRGLAPNFKVQRALNLDGGSSSAFWFAGERGPFSISEQKTVRDFVAVVPK
ncbi:MAG TPA: phosphodiester glycosidase family protein [Chthoniobacterales bacterium]|nr:phosphodiester glycosidase family protein [Chthoniobacterales bacterium]